MKQVPANENNYSKGRNGKTIDKVIVHWMVGTLASTDATFQNPTRLASAHYGIEDDEIHQYVQEQDTAWHASNLTINRESIGIEHSGGNLLPDGTRRKPSELTHQTSGKLIGEICRRYNIPIDNEHILPHNKYSNTQCPGTLDIPLLISIAKGSGQPVPPMNDDLKKILDHYKVKSADELISMVDEQIKFLEEERKKTTALNEEIKKLKENPITPPDETNDKFVINGKTETYTKDGITTTINYAVKG